MAEPIPFRQQNTDLTAPSDSSNILELPAHCVDGLILSKWKFTNPEIDEIVRTGVIWLWVKGNRMPPVMLQATDPFTTSNRGD